MKKLIFGMLVLICIMAQLVYARTFADPTIELEGKKITADAASGEDPVIDDTEKQLDGFEFLIMAGYDFGGAVQLEAEAGKTSPPEWKTNNSLSLTMEIPYFFKKNFALGVGGTFLTERSLSEYSDSLNYAAGYGLFRYQYDIPDTSITLFGQLNIGISGSEWYADGEFLTTMSGMYYSANAGVLFGKSLELRLGYSLFTADSVTFDEFGTAGEVEYSSTYGVFTAAVGYMF